MSKRAANNDKLFTIFLRGLPYFFIFCLLLSLMLVTLGSEAMAEAASSSDDALPEYSIQLSGSGSSSDCSSVILSGSTVTITEAGSYIVNGTLSDGQLRVDTDKDSKVRLILNGVTISNANTAAIYVVSADKVVLNLAEGTQNALSTEGSFVQTDENKVDAVIFSKDDLTVSGSGSLTVTSPSGHGIVSKDDLKIKSGPVTVTSGRKALSVNDTLTVEDGTLTLKAGTEGMESTYVLINGGNISIEAGDDGINATWSSDTLSPLVEINGGSINIVMGQGDTDGIDSNGDLIITGGTIDITGNSCFDCDGKITFTGGTVITNGQQVDTIPNQMMGGFGGRGGMGHGGFGDENGNGFGMQEGSGDFGNAPGGMGPGGQRGHGGFGGGAPAGGW